MNLTDFTALVKTTAKRGSTLDSVIPVFIRSSVKWLERNYTLQYMRKYASFTLDPESANPRAISFPNDRVKELDFIRFLGANGSYSYPRKVDPQELSGSISGMPEAYWLDGVDFIWWDNTPVEETEGEIKYTQYTDWAAVGGSDEPWILKHADDLILAQTMLLIAPYIRDPALAAQFKPLRDEAIRTLVLADEAFQQGPSRVERMSYGRLD